MTAALKGSHDFPIIAEVKLASPSLGNISAHSPGDLAKRYAKGGAVALSVLTEPNFFHGDCRISPPQWELVFRSL